MTRRLKMSLGALLCLFAMGGTLFAHHGTGAAYDDTHRITTKATVTNFMWTNPHGQLYFDIKDDNGEVQNWGVELSNPGNLIRQGWTNRSFKPGDQILVTFLPANEDRHFGGCATMMAMDGKKYHSNQACDGGVTDSAISKLPVKPGYTAVEVKFPEDAPGDAKGSQAQDQQ